MTFHNGILCALMILMAAALRLLPHRLAPHGVGIDHWFWKAYIEAYRRDHKFPPVLPQFLFDEQQWYPPLFPMLMARLPPVAFDRYGHVIAIVIDLMRMLLVMLAVYLLTGRTNALLAAGMVYAFTPILISYNVQLNPRGLGALFLDGVVLLLVWLIWHDGPAWLWIAVAVLSGLILLTHKMTTQLFWFCCLGGSIVMGDGRLAALIPISIVSALLLSKGFYLNVLKAHGDIVSFWHLNWRWLSAQPILESPLYGEPGYETPTKYFRSGIRGLKRRMQYIFGFNPWGWMVLLSSLWVYGPGSHLTSEDRWMIHWLALTLIFVLATTFIPILLCFGNGYLYVYNSSVPAALLVGMIWGGNKHDWVVNIILAFTLAACVSGICFYLWTLRNSKTMKVDADMERMLRRLRELPEGIAMCFPQHWHDVVAYKAAKPVLFGGHGYGFQRLQPIFPRVLKPISEIMAQHRVRYLLTYDGYLPQRFINDLPPSSVEAFGSYLLYTAIA